MKEMVYSAERKNEILDSGFCFGLLYYILNLGPHPTAYIKVPKGAKYFGKNIYDINIEVHGGITYAEEGLYVNDTYIDGYFIGWDYAHFGDYFGFENRYPVTYRTNAKKWTTQEIFKEVRKACYQIQYRGEVK